MAMVVVTKVEGGPSLFKVGDICELNGDSLTHPRGILPYRMSDYCVKGSNWCVKFEPLFKPFRPTLTCDQCGTVVEDSDEIHNEYGVYRCTTCL